MYPVQSRKIVGAERSAAVRKKECTEDYYQQDGRPNNPGAGIPDAVPVQNLARRRSDRCFHNLLQFTCYFGYRHQVQNLGPAHGVRINLLFKGTPEEMSDPRKTSRNGVAQARE